MTARDHYLSSALQFLGSYLENKNLSPDVARQAVDTFHRYLSHRQDFSIWNESELLTSVKPTTAAQRLIADTLTQFVQSHPPYQTNVFLHAFLLALKDDGCSSSTIRNYRSDISQFLSFSNQTEVANAITKPKVAEFVAYQRSKGLQDSSIERKLKSLNQFGEWLHREMILTNNPLGEYRVEMYEAKDKNQLTTTPVVTPSAHTPHTPHIFFTPEEHRLVHARKLQERRAHPRW